ncbi:MAG: multidrug effflux MFS transporter [Sphingobacteriia bacterium]|nr:multidrug effflux MFS transporter [Sphingobacteriia bacterium]
MRLDYLPYLIGCLVALADSASDIYAPSLPAISEYFHTTEKVTALTMSINLIGIAFSGLIYGPLSDYYGRRPILLISWSGFVFGSILSLFAHSIEYLIIFRFIQGLGGGAAFVIGISTLRDVFDSEKYSKILSKIGMIVALSPGIGPIVGSIIADKYDWKAVFLLVTISGIIGLIALFFLLPETNKKNVIERVFVKNIIKTYLKLVINPYYFGFIFLKIATLFWLWGELGNLPFIFINGMGLDVGYYGYFFAFGVVIYTLGTIFNQRFVSYLGITRMLNLGVALTIISSVILIIGNILANMNPWAFQICKIPAAFGIALIFGNATTKALSTVGKDTGAAAALMAAFEMIVGSIGIMVVSKFYDGTTLPLAIVMLLSSISAAIVLYFLQKFPKDESNEPKPVLTN